jgi:hypothetical protein
MENCISYSPLALRESYVEIIGRDEGCHLGLKKCFFVSSLQNLTQNGPLRVKERALALCGRACVVAFSRGTFCIKRALRENHES